MAGKKTIFLLDKGFLFTIYNTLVVKVVKLVISWETAGKKTFFLLDKGFLFSVS